MNEAAVMFQLMVFGMKMELSEGNPEAMTPLDVSETLEFFGNRLIGSTKE